MKRFCGCLILAFALVLIQAACKKDINTPPPPPPPPPIEDKALTGHWNVDYHVVTNVIGSPQLRDTFYQVHNEYAEFTADSVTTYSWTCISIDKTASPPTVKFEEMCEFKWTNHYVRNATRYITYTPNHTDTTDIIKLTDLELVIHSKIPASFGFTDSYSHLTK